MKRVRLIKPLKQERARPRAPTPINDDTRPDANFTGTLEDWDDRVFLHAESFRVWRFTPKGRDSAEFPDFVQAIRAALGAMKEGMAVLVYAVAETGRHQALVPTRWEHYATLYNAQQDAKRLKAHQDAQQTVWDTKIKPRREAKREAKRHAKRSD
jgi:hypothetical protein